MNNDRFPFRQQKKTEKRKIFFHAQKKQPAPLKSRIAKKPNWQR